MNLASILAIIFRRRPPATLVPDLSLNAATLDPGTIGEDYSGAGGYQLTWRGGTGGPVRIDATGNLLGLTLSASGLLDGTPTVTGEGTFTATITDLTSLEVASHDYTLIVTTPLELAESGMADALVGGSVAHQFSAFGGRSPYAFHLANTPPLGGALSSAGLYTQIPNTPGPVTLRVYATDADDRRSGTVTYQFTAWTDVVVTNTSLPQGTVGSSYSSQITASGQNLQYSASGQPSWFSVNSSTGAITNSSAVGAFNGTVRLQATNLVSGDFAYVDLLLRVTTVRPVITTTTLGYGTVATAVTAGEVTMAATSSYLPLLWIIVGGTTPPGMQLDINGRWIGNPNVVGLYAPQIQCVDSTGNPSDIATIQYRVAAAVVVTDPGAISTTAGVAFSRQMAATGGYGTITWSNGGGALPPGLTMNAAGLISGTPTTSGGYSFIPRATDSQGRQGTLQIGFTINSTLSFTNTSLASATAGTSYVPAGAIVATGGTLPRVITKTGSAWLSVTTGGVLSGTPAAVYVGTSNQTFTVTDAVGAVNSLVLPITVAAAAGNPVVNPRSTPVGRIGTPYSVILTASSGTGTYVTWAVSAGALPAGLSIRTLGDGTGEVYGTPTTLYSTAGVNITVTDSFPHTSAAVTFTFEVQAALTGGADNWAYRSALPNVVMASRFDTAREVTDYAWRSTFANDPSDPFWSDPATTAWVNRSLADGQHAVTDDQAYILPGRVGCFRQIHRPSRGETTAEWNRRLDDSFLAYDAGFNEGDEIWVYRRYQLDQYTAESHTVTATGSAASWKTDAISLSIGSSTANQLYDTNARFYDILQFTKQVPAGNYVGINSGNTVTDPGSASLDLIYQQLVNHTSAATHPAGLDPNTGTSREQYLKRLGGSQHRSQESSDLPRDSDQTQGALMFRRDAVNAPIGGLTRLKIGTFGVANSEYERWWHVDGKDFVKAHEQADLLLVQHNESISCSATPQNAIGTVYNTMASGGKTPSSGNWRPSAIWLMGLQSTSRIGNSNNHPLGNLDMKIFWHEIMCRRGAVGLPAAGFTVPPTSAYASSGGGTPSGWSEMTTVNNGNVTALDAVTENWVGAGYGNKISAFGGWTMDRVRGIIYSLLGAGHSSDGPINAILENVIGTGANIEGWNELDTSLASSSVIQQLSSANNFSYNDNADPALCRPGARHNYGTCAIMNDGRGIQGGGAAYVSNAGPALQVVIFDFNAMRTGRPVSECYLKFTTPAGLFSGIAGSSNVAGLYDWINDKYFLWHTGGSYTVFDLNPGVSQYTFSALVSPSNPFTAGASGSGAALSLSRTSDGVMRILGIRNGTNTPRVACWPWNGSSLGARVAVTSTGETGLVDGTAGVPAVDWDRWGYCYYGMVTTNGNANSGVYLYKGVWTGTSTINWTRSLVNVTPSIAQSVGGGWGKLFVTATDIWLVTNEGQSVVKLAKF
jgi:hypothetical protein